MDVVIDPNKLWIKAFNPVMDSIMQHKYQNFIMPGGRGSTKSSFLGGFAIPLLIISNPTCHAVCFRQVGTTLKTSIYAQIEWGINELGIRDYFIFHTSPLEIIYKPTGQKILFLGLDDPGKVKSIKLPFGYIGITWWEELDQFSGPRAIRKSLQSTMRGGSKFWNFMSFNPPISMNNWANEYTEEAERLRKKDTLVVRSNYLQVPVEWLGQAFIDEAEFLKETNPRAYKNEYLGIPVGTGGNIFDNAEDLEMPDQLIATFDTIYNGLDWGFANDPNAYVKMYFDKTRQDLYIYGEHYMVHEKNKDLFEELYKDTTHLMKRKWVYDDTTRQEYEVYDPVPLMEMNELLTADSAEPKSIADFKSYGAFFRAAEKGPDSIRYGIKWLQSLRHIYIDKDRCPNTYREFMHYEYERDKDGNIISSYPDKDNHTIDATRYALERFYKHRGN